MLTKLTIQNDIQGKITTGSETVLLPSSSIHRLLLTQNVVADVLVPTTFNTGSQVHVMAQFSFTPGKTVYVQVGDTPTLTLPVNDTEVLAQGEINPRSRLIELGDTVQLITPDTGVYVSIAYYAIP